jgi:CRISPR-associated protein (TIGR03986 family)
VVAAADDSQDLPNHDAYQPGRHTGFFTVILETKSPLFVRAGLSRERVSNQPSEWEQAERQKNSSNEGIPFRALLKNKPEFFYTNDANEPVIPGSTLRGMLRSLLEIVSYGKMNRVSDKRLFFRTVDNTAVGLAYRDRMVGSLAFGNKVEAGFIQATAGGRYLIRACEVLRVSRDLLFDVLPGGGREPAETLYEGRGPNMTPKWNYQYHPVWVRRSARGREVDDITSRPRDDYEEGHLVITGNMQDKRKEFVFLIPLEDAATIVVPKEMADRFHDKDQITLWQQRAFPKDKPIQNGRQQKGWLANRTPPEGQPVFFLRERREGETQETLSFFGRAQMFRLPYLRGPKDLIPDYLRKEETVDYADALFGYVRNKKLDTKLLAGDKRIAYAGRVFVSDATLQPGQKNLWLDANYIVPRILGGPQATCFQHYLVQQTARKDSLNHYDTPGATLRGHKIYWTHKQVGMKDIIAIPAPPDTSTQHTQFKPLGAGKLFTFKVHFENLSDVELGALCWTLQPQGDPAQQYFHKLGMGKPLGMGKVLLKDITLEITNRPARYTGLFNGGQWLTGAKTDEIGPFLTAFDQEMRKKLGLEHQCRSLAEIKRIAILLRMMAEPDFRTDSTCRNAIAFDDAGTPDLRYMLIIDGKTGNDYRNRPVLPDPSWSYFGKMTAVAVEQPGTVAAASNIPLPTLTLQELRSKLPKADTPKPREGVYKGLWVTIVRSGKPGKFVVTVEGETDEFSIDIPFQKEDRCRCDVTYKNGRAQSGKFKSWT